MSAPEWALTEEAFGAFCDDRHLDDTDENFALFEAWLGGDVLHRNEDGTFFTTPYEPWDGVEPW